MVAHRDDVNPCCEEFLNDIRRNAGTCRGILAVRHTKVHRLLGDKRAKSPLQCVAAGPADYITNSKDSKHGHADK
jgi:hypothetical protein